MKIGWIYVDNLSAPNCIRSDFLRLPLHWSSEVEEIDFLEDGRAVSF